MMFDKLIAVLKRNWIWSLIGITVVLLIINLAIFYPGYMSPDSLNQLYQAKGLQPVTDFTPPAMTLVWRLLLDITGKPASMLVLQLSLLWSALALLAIYVWKVSDRRKLSLLVLALGVLPFTLDISGVVWKDVQMTNSLLLATALIVFLGLTRNKWLRIILSVSGIALISYACLVRYNALPAVVPLNFLIVRAWWPTWRIRWQVVASVVIAVAMAGLFPLVNIVGNVQSSHPVSAIFIDDIANISSVKEVEQSSIPAPLKRDFVAAIDCQVQKNSLVNNFYLCANNTARQDFQFTYYASMKSYWISMFIHHLPSYALYRFETFFAFIFTPTAPGYIWQDGINSNTLNLTPRFPGLGDTAGIYVTGFGYSHLSMFFEPWFWLAVSCLVIRFAKKAKQHYMIVLALGVSSLLYFLSYLPTGTTGDYRYIYWNVYALLIAATLFLVDYMHARGARSEKSLRRPGAIKPRATKRRTTRPA